MYYIVHFTYMLLYICTFYAVNGERTMFCTTNARRARTRYHANKPNFRARNANDITKFLPRAPLKSTVDPLTSNSLAVSQFHHLPSVVQKIPTALLRIRVKEESRHFSHFQLLQRLFSSAKPTRGSTKLTMLSC